MRIFSRKTETNMPEACLCVRHMEECVLLTVFRKNMHKNRIGIVCLE